MRIEKAKKLHIERRTLVVHLIMAILWMPFSFALMELFGLDDVIKLAMDAIWLSIAIMPFTREKTLVSKRTMPAAVLVGLFFLYTLIVYIFRYQSIFYYLWGLRNNFRFYIVFFAVASYLDEEDGYKCLRVFERLFWPNIAICLIQFFMGYHQDYLGGIFGVSIGCNGYLLIYLIIMVSKSILDYMNHKVSILSCFPKCAAALTIAALAELKFFFFIFIFLLVAATLLTSFSFRKMVFLGISAVVVAVLAGLLGTIYESFSGFLSVNTLQHAISLKNYATGSDMGRFSAMSIISQRFLQSIPDKLFGLGLGNCDTSSIKACSSRFFASYGNTHYSYFSYAFMFIENGYIGLALYVLFFVICLTTAFKRLNNRSGNQTFCQMAIIVSMVCFMLLFYNSSLRMETGYMIYFILALAFLKPEPKRKD